MAKPKPVYDEKTAKLITNMAGHGCTCVEIGLLLRNK